MNENNLFKYWQNVLTGSVEALSYPNLIFKACSDSDLVEIFSDKSCTYWLLGGTRYANIILVVPIKLLQEN